MVEVEGLKNTFPYLGNITVAGRTRKEHDINVTRLQNVLTKRNWTLNDSKTISSVSSIIILGYCVGNNIIKPDSDRLEPLQRLSTPENLNSLKRVLGLFAYNAKWILQFSERKRLKQTTKFLLDDAALRDFESLGGRVVSASGSEACVTSSMPTSAIIYDAYTSIKKKKKKKKKLKSWLVVRT